jgi:AcrR family transcriptional regulator
MKSPRGQGEHLRTEILDAAEKLLIDTADAEAVSIRAVADSVGVTAPTIYRHFEDKDALITQVCERAFAELHQRMADRIGEEADPIERLCRIGEAYVNFGLEKGGHYRVLFMQRGPEATEPRSWDDLLAETNGFGLLVAECQRAIDAGVDAPDAGTLALNLWATVHGMLSLRLIKPLLPWPPVQRQLDLMTAQLRATLRR